MKRAIGGNVRRVSPRLAVAAIATAIVTIGVSTPALAQRVVTHRVKRGDTLALLAGEIYGDRRYAILIMAANNLAHEAELRPGSRLKIPTNHEITTSAGDTLESLAEQYLGDPERKKFLANFNDISSTASLPAGVAIKIPHVVTHTAADRERISSIAASYFVASKKGKTRLIKQYNFLTGDVLEPGQSIEIPIDNVEVRPSRRSRPDADSRARARKRIQTQKQARRVLADAQRAWYAGDYDAVKQLLTAVDTAYLDAEDAIQLDLLVGRTHVAFGETDSALARFKKVLERMPDHTLNPYEYSPKVRQLWRTAGGKVGSSN